MSAPGIQNTANLLADVQTNFMDTYEVKPTGLLEAVMSVMDDVPMQWRQNRFFYYKTLPLAEYIPYGEEVSFGDLQQESYTIDAFLYGKALTNRAAA